jgi:hypothetical protein
MREIFWVSDVSCLLVSLVRTTKNYAKTTYSMKCAFAAVSSIATTALRSTRGTKRRIGGEGGRGGVPGVERLCRKPKQKQRLTAYPNRRVS